MGVTNFANTFAPRGKVPNKFKAEPHHTP